MIAPSQTVWGTETLRLWLAMVLLVVTVGGCQQRASSAAASSSASSNPTSAEAASATPTAAVVDGEAARSTHAGNNDPRDEQANAAGAAGMAESSRAAASDGLVSSTDGDKPVATASGDAKPTSASSSVASTARVGSDGRNAAAVRSAGAAARRAPVRRKQGGSSGTRDITFDDIKFDIEKDEPFEREKLTPQIESLDKKRIRIRGYILPSFQQHGITQFVLVRDNQECCFGPGAALYDCIVVEMKPGKAIDYTIRPVAVEGTFSIRELKGPDGKHLAIYHIEGEKVR